MGLVKGVRPWRLATLPPTGRALSTARGVAAALLPPRAVSTLQSIWPLLEEIAVSGCPQQKQRWRRKEYVATFGRLGGQRGEPLAPAIQHSVALFGKCKVLWRGHCLPRLPHRRLVQVCVHPRQERCMTQLVACSMRTTTVIGGGSD